MFENGANIDLKIWDNLIQIEAIIHNSQHNIFESKTSCCQLIDK